MAERRLHVLNNSRAAAFRRCPRLHFFAYELGFAAAFRAPSLVTGSAWHASLEAWWRAIAEGRRHEAFDAAIAALAPAADPYERVRAEVIMAGYHARWIDEPLEVLGVEVPFEGALVDPITGDTHPEFILGGTIDAICRTRSGHVLVVEHKTSSEDFRPGAYYWERLRLNAQVSQYLAAGPLLGFDFAGCLYDVIGKAPSLEPKLATPVEERKYTKQGFLYARQRDTDEDLEEFRARLIEAIVADPAAFYGRAEIVRFAGELDDSILDVWQVADLITEARARSRWPRNPDGCFAYRRECDFYAVCARGESLENSELFVNEREETKGHAA